MALTIETGLNVPNANSYLDLTAIRAYASARGVTLSVVDATLEPLVIKAMDYIESFRSEFQGMRTFPTQPLQWPRAEISYTDFYLGQIASEYGIMIDCVTIANNVIPQQLKDVLCQVVMAINAGVNFANYNQDQKFIIEEKVGPLSWKFSESGGDGTSISVGSIDDMMDILLYPCGNDGSVLRTVRV